MIKKHKILIVIVTHNRRKSVIETITKIMEQNIPCKFHVMVMDNGSTDGTPDAIKRIQKIYANVMMVPYDRNLGVEAHSRAYALFGKYNKFMLFLDDDCYPKHPGTIAGMLSVFEKNKNCDIVATTIRNMDSRQGREFARFRVAKETTGFAGACFAVRCDLWPKIDYLFDSNFFLYRNEMDLSIRILNSGGKIMTNDNFVAYHNYQPNLGNNKKQAFYYTRNTFFIIWKYAGAKLWFKYTLKFLFQIFKATFQQKTFVFLHAFIRSILDYNGRKHKVDQAVLAKVNPSLTPALTGYK